MLVGSAPRSAIAQPATAVSLSDFEALAQQRLTPQALAFVAGGAADELTLRWNREALDRIRLRSRVLVDVSRVDTRVTLFGQALPSPILVAPTAFHGLIHRDAEVATARGAARADAVMVISTLASAAVDDIARAAAAPAPWF